MRIDNPILNENFIQFTRKIHAELRGDFNTVRGFHGTRPENIEGIAANGLLKVGHPRNPSKAVDQGYFGDPQQGVYLSRCILSFALMIVIFLTHSIY